MIKIAKLIYTIITLIGMLVTGQNALILKEIETKVQRMAIPNVTSHSQININ
ncbi:hypothetical protein [Cetobacterium sp.]|uniref:hypothetical protein n=1 Tax=Cetobacterium sp. TaxID=2071632 RepID=UPI003F67EFD1